LRDAKWYAKRVTRGIANAAITIVLYIYLLPELFNKLYENLGYTPGPLHPTSTYLAFTLIIVGLHTAASLLEESIFEPVLRSSANLFGVIYVLSFLGNGTLSVNNVPAGNGTYVDLEMELGPIMIIFYAFFVAPSMAMPFIDYFFRERTGEG